MSSEAGRGADAPDVALALAHDVRNALGPLVLRLDLLRERAEREGRAADLADLQAARRAAARVERLAANLAEARRVERDLTRHVPAPVRLAVLARETAVLLGTDTIPVEVAAPRQLVASGDAEALRRALENLVANAIQHAPRGTAVEVTVEREVRAGRPWAVLRVRDRGPGIPPELRPRLFRPFAPGPRSRGLGLGLFLARETALLHRGDLSAADAPGGGTVFTLAWPTDTAMPGEPPEGGDGTT